MTSTSANPSQLFLLSDHIKLSLLERQRAISLNLEPNAQDGQISRSLDQLRDGIEDLKVRGGGDDWSQVKALQSQYDGLRAQFHGFSSSNDHSANTNNNNTLNQPNNPTLASDFAAAKNLKPSLQSPPLSNSKPSKSVRFSDTTNNINKNYDDADPEFAAARSKLFPPYHDDPSSTTTTTTTTDNNGNDGYKNSDSKLTPTQIHAHHHTILAEQDAQLDQLSSSIGRQHELSIQIGNELDEHVDLLDDVDGHVDRQAAQLDRAKGRLGKVARAAGENRGMTVIVVLIVVLVLLIMITK